MVLMIFRNVADRVETDGAPDNAHDQRHDDGELIHEQAVLDLHRTAGGNLKGYHNQRLDHDEHHGEVSFCAEGNINDERCDEHLYHQHESIDPMALGVEVYRPLIQIRDQQIDRNRAQHNIGHDPNRSSESGPRRQYQCQSCDA